MAFSLIDLGSLKRIGIRDYAANAEEANAQYVRELEQGVEMTDPDAQYHLFIQMLAVAMKTLSLDALARAEELLQAAAAQGHERAQASLETWPLLKSAAEQRIARGPS